MANETKRPSSRETSSRETKEAPRSEAHARPISARASSQRNESLLFLAIVGASLIALNVLGVFFFSRIDVTENRAFTLSEGSREVVRELEDTLTITAYFTENLPPPFNSQERYVRDILAEYEAASNGHVRVRIVHPDPADVDQRREAESAGVQLMQHQRLEQSNVTIVEGFRGVVFEYLGDREVIGALAQAGTEGLEYAFTMKIKEIIGDDLPIGVVQGHESPTPTKGLSILQRMLPTYSMREVDASQEIDRNLRALLVVDPQSELSETELRRINQYVMRGGSLAVFGGAMKVNLESMPELRAEPAGSGINRLLEPWGVRMRENIVADLHCGQVPFRTPIGFMVPVPYPPAPQVALSQEQSRHPVLFRLNQATFFFAAPLETTDAFEERGTVLITSSEQSWAMGSDVSLRIRQPNEWRSVVPRQFDGPHPLAVAIEGTLPSAFPATGSGESDIQAPEQSEEPARVLVFGSPSVIRDEFLPQGERANEQDVASMMAIVLNAIDWLAQDDDLIAIRAKTIEEPPLDVPRAMIEAVEDAREAQESNDAAGLEAAAERHEQAERSWAFTKTAYQVGNIVLIPLAVALFGIARWQLRQRRKATLKL